MTGAKLMRCFILEGDGGGRLPAPAEIRCLVSAREQPQRHGEAATGLLRWRKKGILPLPIDMWGPLMAH
jgi:hypothetical protein